MRTIKVLTLLIMVYQSYRLEQLDLQLKITEHQLERAEQRATEAKEKLAAYKYEDYRNDEDY